MGVITSGLEFEWSKAQDAARAIVKICEDSGYVPHEELLHHQRLLDAIDKFGRVCSEIQVIVDALKLRRTEDKPKPPTVGAPAWATRDAAFNGPRYACQCDACKR